MNENSNESESQRGNGKHFITFTIPVDKELLEKAVDEKNTKADRSNKNYIV